MIDFTAPPLKKVGYSFSFIPFVHIPTKDNCEHLPHSSKLWVLKPDVSRPNWEIVNTYVRMSWLEIDDAVKSFHVFDLPTYRPSGFPHPPSTLRRLFELIILVSNCYLWNIILVLMHKEFADKGLVGTVKHGA